RLRRILDNEGAAVCIWRQMRNELGDGMTGLEDRCLFSNTEMSLNSTGLAPLALDFDANDWRSSKRPHTARSKAAQREYCRFDVTSASSRSVNGAKINPHLRHQVRP